MEIVYKDTEEDDEIPDESPNAEELIKIHDQLIPRGSITNNILSHSFVIDTPMSMLSSINDSRRESEQYSNRNNLYKENSMSVQNNDAYNSIEFMSPQSNFSGSDKIYDLRAVSNWERIFKRWMLEYRRHRLRKAAKNFMQETSHKQTKNQYIAKKKMPSIYSSTNSYKMYPWIRFLQRIRRLIKKNGTYRNIIFPR